MTPPPSYEYYGMMAEFWDLFRGDTSTWDDRFFFLDVVRKYGGPVLDVGCGTGRILLNFMQQGFDMDGVDNSPEMLARLPGGVLAMPFMTLWKQGNSLESEWTREATRSYTQEQAVALYEEAGFEDLQVFHEFTFEPAKPEDETFCVLGFKAK